MRETILLVEIFGDGKGFDQMSAVPDSTKEELLRAHLEKRYGVHVEGMDRLDRGVYRVSLRDGRRWVVRVFPEKRPMEQIEGDAVALRYLERQDFPAERCAAADPVSALYGRGILVTTYVEGAVADSAMTRCAHSVS